MDKDISQLKISAPVSAATAAALEILEADLETGAVEEVIHQVARGRQFGAIVVTNYLYRPLLPLLPGLLSAGGRLIYETFMVGNEAFGRPRNADFLLREDELRNRFAESLAVHAFEQGYREQPTERVIQRVVAVKDAMTAAHET